ncbi:MAG TPA: NYN domain-containing protein [Acidimicrobiales bacterium]|nr:NYN domain-containing protein [Acidimicrobiales bacterium]
MQLIVDGMNVIGSRPDGWWRDRPAAQRALVRTIEAAGATRLGGACTVVFDGRPVDLDDGEVEVCFAPGGPNAADDVIAALVEASDEPGQLMVVTSDTALAARVRAAGAQVEAATAFRRRLGEDHRR